MAVLDDLGSTLNDLLAEGGRAAIAARYSQQPKSYVSVPVSPPGTSNVPVTAQPAPASTFDKKLILYGLGFLALLVVGVSLVRR